MYSGGDTDIEYPGPVGSFQMFKTEGHKLMIHHAWLKAVYYFTRALALQDGDPETLVMRSHCHLKSGHPDKAMADVDRVLKDDCKNAPALIQRAETFYNQGYFEKALMYFHQGRHLKPHWEACHLGIQKSEGCIKNAIGDTKLLLTKLGDLSFFQRQIEADKLERSGKTKHAQTKMRKRREVEVVEKPPIKDIHSERRIVALLGDLYGDRMYLERILNEADEEREIGRCIHEEAYETIMYLDKRSDIWRQEEPPRNRKKRTRLASITAEREHINRQVGREISRIDTEQAEEKYQESLYRAQQLLDKVLAYPQGVIKKREEVITTIHSYIGNAHFEMGHLKLALDQFKMQKADADRYGIEQAKNRALDSMGRTFAKMGEYKKAINIWNVKLPLATEPAEKGWLLHEMARCHYALENYQRARELGERALKEANMTSNTMWQMNTQVLVAQAQVRLGENREALESYLHAYALAELENEQDVMAAILRAIGEVNKLIAMELAAMQEVVEEEEEEEPLTMTVASQTEDRAVRQEDVDELEVEYLYSIPSIILEEIIAEESAKAVEVEEEEEKDRPFGHQAYVTMATNDVYALGAMVLGFTLRQSGTERRLVVMITSEVTEKMRKLLSMMFDLLFDVDVIDSKDIKNLCLLQRGDLGVTFTKIHCWRLIQFEKGVFMDADTMVLQNIDDLFDREELSAAPDAGWPDCFNSGVFVFIPSLDTFEKLLRFALSVGSFDGGDQGLLNLYFDKWATESLDKHLPFTYNLVWQGFYSYQPAYRQFGDDTKVVHFIGAVKPWHFRYSALTCRIECRCPIEIIQNKELLQLWWDIFMSKIQPLLTKDMCGIVGQLARLNVRSVGYYTPEQMEERQKQYNWENNQIDYMGSDCFENIRKKLDEIIKSSPINQEEVEAKEERRKKRKCKCRVKRQRGRSPRRSGRSPKR